MGSSMIIKLDTDAVEALVFGRDDSDEARLSISSSIVTQFVNRYLKGVVSDEIVKDAVKLLKVGIQDRIKEMVGERSMMGRVNLTEETRDEIKKAVKSVLVSFIHDEVVKALPGALDEVVPILKQHLTQEGVKAIKAQIQEQIKASI